MVYNFVKTQKSMSTTPAMLERVTGLRKGVRIDHMQGKGGACVLALE